MYMSLTPDSYLFVFRPLLYTLHSVTFLTTQNHVLGMVLRIYVVPNCIYKSMIFQVFPTVENVRTSLEGYKGKLAGNLLFLVYLSNLIRIFFMLHQPVIKTQNLF